MQHYQQALMLNPPSPQRTRASRRALSGARRTGQAEQQLAVLEEICLVPCTELDDLKQAIATYRKLVAREATIR